MMMGCFDTFVSFTDWRVYSCMRPDLPVMSIRTNARSILPVFAPPQNANMATAKVTCSERYCLLVRCLITFSLKRRHGRMVKGVGHLDHV